MKNDRLFTMVPNCAFHKIVRQYAFERGRPILTLEQQRAALLNYVQLAIYNN